MTSNPKTNRKAVISHGFSRCQLLTQELSGKNMKTQNMSKKPYPDSEKMRLYNFPRMNIDTGTDSGQWYAIMNSTKAHGDSETEAIGTWLKL